MSYVERHHEHDMRVDLCVSKLMYVSYNVVLNCLAKMQNIRSKKNLAKHLSPHTEAYTHNLVYLMMMMMMMNVS